MIAFLSGRLSRRNDANNVTVCSFTVTDYEDAGTIAHSEHNESFFGFGMRLVEELSSEVVVENGLGFLKRNPVVYFIRLRFGGTPLEVDHTYSACINPRKSRFALTGV